MNLSDETYSISGHHRADTAGPAAWLPRLRARLHRIGLARTARLRRAREMRELYRFSDRELLDIGLTRLDIRLIEKGKYRQDR